MNQNIKIKSIQSELYCLKCIYKNIALKCHIQKMLLGEKSILTTKAYFYDSKIILLL